MPDYRRICSHLIIALSKVIDDAKSAIEEAEESIISDEANPQTPYLLSSKEDA